MVWSCSSILISFYVNYIYLSTIIFFQSDVPVAPIVPNQSKKKKNSSKIPEMARTQNKSVAKPKIEKDLNNYLVGTCLLMCPLDEIAL